MTVFTISCSSLLRFSCCQCFPVYFAVWLHSMRCFGLYLSLKFLVASFQWRAPICTNANTFHPVNLILHHKIVHSLKQVFTCSPTFRFFTDQQVLHKLVFINKSDITNEMGVFVLVCFVQLKCKPSLSWSIVSSAITSILLFIVEALWEVIYLHLQQRLYHVKQQQAKPALLQLCGVFYTV